MSLKSAEHNSTSCCYKAAMRGTLEYLVRLFGGGDHHSHKSKKNNKRRQLQTVELKVRMDCEGCELKVKNALSSLKGVQSVKVLKRAQSTGDKSELWPYVPYNAVSQPYVAAAYDRRAPPGHVRSMETAATYVSSHVSRPEDRLTNMFNDENPNACSVM